MVEKKTGVFGPQIRNWIPFLGGGPSLPEKPVLLPYGRWTCYGFAAGTATLALIITYAVPPLREQPPTLLFFAAVVLTSWYAGLRAGFASSVLSMLMLDLFFVRSMLPWQMEIVEDGSDFVAFAVVTWLVSTFQDRWRQTHHKLAAVEQEMKVARRIQQRFFPAAAPSIAGFEIAGSCFPAEDTGGDFFDYISMPDGHLGIAIGDVSGHGLGPALIMVLLRAYIRALALTYSDPEEILARANRLVHEDTEDDWFATVFLMQLDTHSGTFVYAGAGHVSYLIDALGELTLLPSTDIPLGIQADAPVPRSPTCVLQPGQILILLSDGIVESHSTDGEPFGMARVLETVRRHREQPAGEMVAAIHRAACSHCGDRQEDDMTIVIVKATC